MTNSTGQPLHRIAIVGGGAGGLELAVRLGRRLGRRRRAEVTLIDAARTHLWKPLLHQVAAGTLDTHADEIEYLALARKNHFHFRLGSMDRLNRERREIGLAPTCDEQGEEILPRSTIPFDTLALALGSQTNDFNTPGARAYTTMLDSPAQANAFHTRLVNSFLRAQARLEGASRERFTITIIGGGATGVELAAELHMTASIVSSYGLLNFHPEQDLRIVVVDAGARLLPMLPERVSAAVMRELRALGVEVRMNEKVVEIRKDGVRTASGSFIPSDIMVWAAGIRIADFVKNLGGLETNHINQLAVKRTLQTTRDAAIFAIGDCAACPQDEGGKNVPPRAQAAHQQAEMLARSLEGMLNGKPLLDFTYRDYGSLVSLGDYSTVGSLMGAISRGSLFIEGHIAKWMYWWLRKHHQIAVSGVFHTWLATWVEFIDRVRNPRIKLH